ncbi:MAG: twitching motility protein PilT [Acidobacteria bacterium]|nr:twitching motility protein PilT [Acidobacteriota bacterium]
MSRLVYDAGVLVAADRGDRRVWLAHAAQLLERSVPLVPAPVVAQVSRSPQQAQLRRFLAGCHIEPLGERDAHAAGRLLGKSRTADVVDASVVAIAIRYHAVILTGDVEDLERLAAVAGSTVDVVGL